MAAPDFSLGNVVVLGQQGPENQEINFQPPPYRAENYQVTGFSHQTTPQGHTYRLTTPTSTVFVQRSFGHSATVSSRTPTLKRQINQTAPVERNNTREAVFDSLHGAVDVLTKSSLGYMNQNLAQAEIDQNNLELENDIESIQKEIETLQKDIEILNNAEITFDLTEDENRDEIFSLKENLDNLVQGFDSSNVPVDVVENHRDINTPQFQHFPVVNVENIYDKDAIESLLVDFTDGGDGGGEVIETNQFDEILLSNYMVNNHETNQPNAVVRDSGSGSASGLQHKTQDSVPQKTAEIIRGKPVEKVAGPLKNFPRAEKLVSIPSSVSSFITSVKSFINYDGDSQAGSQARAQFTPSSTTEKLGVSDVALKSHPVLDPGSEDQFVKYIPSPSLNTRPSTYKPPTQQSRDSVSLVEQEEKEEQEDDEDVQKFWPESKLNVTYQGDWIG